MKSQNTFHPLTAIFISAVIKKLPFNISSDKMQTWIQNPKTLQRELEKALTPSLLEIDADDIGEQRINITVVKDGESPFHPQTAKFISCIAQNMPEVCNDRMETLIKYPNTLEKALRKALVVDIVVVHTADVAARR